MRCLFFISASANSAEGSASTAQKLQLFTSTEKPYAGRVRTYFFLEKAVENEDKHSLEGVEYGEEVRHDNRGLADEEEPERPGETEQTQQSKSTHDPGPEGQTRQDESSMREVQRREY